MTDVIQRYFDAFSAKDIPAMLACLSDDIAHHVNEGEIRQGRAAFAAFCDQMAACYDESLTDMVLFQNDAGTRAAAEYTVNGTYLRTDADLPPARGQSYVLPAGSFFALSNGAITRVTTYYNLGDWIRQVS